LIDVGSAVVIGNDEGYAANVMLETVADERAQYGGLKPVRVVDPYVPNAASLRELRGATDDDAGVVSVPTRPFTAERYEVLTAFDE
jgi:hypothetical protein